MYKFFPRKHNQIKIITILNSNRIHNEYIVAGRTFYVDFLCKCLGGL